MDYRRGFQRLYAVLAVAWIAVFLITLPPDSLKFWSVPDYAALEKQDTELGFIPDQPYIKTTRAEKTMRLFGVLLAPPLIGYGTLFLVIPWIFRGFRSAKQI